MTIFVVEHACLVHAFDVEGMSLMCMRAYCWSVPIQSSFHSLSPFLFVPTVPIAS